MQRRKSLHRLTNLWSFYSLRTYLYAWSCLVPQWITYIAIQTPIDDRVRDVLDIDDLVDDGVLGVEADLDTGEDTRKSE